MAQGQPGDGSSEACEDPADIDPLSWEEVRLLFDKGLKNEPEMRRF
jgi:hypothetical protein